MLRDPADAAPRTRVKDFLQKLKDDPTLEIARVVEQPGLSAIGGYPEAAFLVEMNPGADVGSNFNGPVVQVAPGTGQHGYLPDRPEMRIAVHDGSRRRGRTKSRCSRYASNRAYYCRDSGCEPAHRQGEKTARSPINSPKNNDVPFV